MISKRRSVISPVHYGFSPHQLTIRWNRKDCGAILKEYHQTGHLQRRMNNDVYVHNYHNQLQILAISALALGENGSCFFRLPYQASVAC